MKHSAIIRIIIYSVTILLLGCVLVWGIQNHNGKNYLDISNLFGGQSLDYDEEGFVIGGGEVDSQDVTDVKINWTAGQVNVIAYEGDQIEMEETSDTDLEQDYEMRYQLENGILRIQFAKSKVSFTGLFKSLNKELTLRIPEDFMLENIDIETTSADVLLQELSAKSMSVNTVSGEIQGDNFVTDEMDGETVSGQIVWTGGTASIVDLESVSGKIKVSFPAMPDNISIETVSGSILLGLPENDGFKVEYDKVSGDFDCEFNVKINKNAAIYKSSKSKIFMETVSGNLKIFKI